MYWREKVVYFECRVVRPVVGTDFLIDIDKKVGKYVTVKGGRFTFLFLACLARIFVCTLTEKNVIIYFLWIFLLGAELSCQLFKGTEIRTFIMVTSK